MTNSAIRPPLHARTGLFAIVEFIGDPREAIWAHYYEQLTEAYHHSRTYRFCRTIIGHLPQ